MKGLLEDAQRAASVTNNNNNNEGDSGSNNESSALIKEAVMSEAGLSEMDL